MIDNLLILKTAFKIVSTIYDLSNDKFIEIINDIADNNQMTGLRVLREDIPKASNHEQEKAILTQAIGHFNSSIENYLSTLEKGNKNFFVKNFNPTNRVRVYERCFISSILIALCYKCLKWEEYKKSYYFKARKFLYQSIYHSLFDISNLGERNLNVTSVYNEDKDPWYAYSKRISYSYWLENKDLKIINKSIKIYPFPFNSEKERKRKMNERGIKVAKKINQNIVEFEENLVDFSDEVFSISKWSVPTFSVDNLLVIVTDEIMISREINVQMKYLTYVNEWNPPT